MSVVRSPFDPVAHQISSNRHIAFAVVQFNEDASTVPNAAVKKVIAVAESFDRPGYRIALGGGPIGNVITAAPGPSEGAGILGAMIIMLIAFGSVVAMGLPILTALFGIAIGFALEDLLSHILNVPIFAPEMLAMIGLGVGIDYALFIVTRYRQGLFEGRDPRQAVATALATSGRAVLFAGTDRRHLPARSLPPAAAVPPGPRGRDDRRRAARDGRRAHACSPPCSASRDGPSTACTCPSCCRPGPPRRPTASGTAGAG